MTALLGVGSFLLTGAALLGWRAGPAWAWAALAVATACFAAEIELVRQRGRAVVGARRA